MPAGANDRGWGAVLALLLACMVLSVVQPALLITVPLALLLLGTSWRRPLVVVAGAVLLAVSLARVGSDPLANLERGWALLLGAWFLVAVVALPARRFMERALVSVFAAGVSVVALLWVNRGATSIIDGFFADRLKTGAAQAVSSWRIPSGWDQFSVQITSAVNRAAELQAMLYPALLALASLAGMAIAWWAYRRLTAPDEKPLAPLREFRFPDGLIWLLIAGIALMLVPLDWPADRAGSNLLAFMGALYALRGAAVLLVIGGAPGPVTALVMGLALVFLYPIVMAATFLVGLSDTWLDIRTKRNGPEESNK